MGLEVNLLDVTFILPLCRNLVVVQLAHFKLLEYTLIIVLRLFKTFLEVQELLVKQILLF